MSGKNLGQVTSPSLFGFGLWKETRVSENVACLFVNGLNQVCRGAGFTLR